LLGLIRKVKGDVLIVSIKKTFVCYSITLLIGIIVGFGVTYYFCNRIIQNERSIKAGIIADHQRTREDLGDARESIKSLKTERDSKQRTVERVTKYNQQLEVRNKRLEELSKQRQDIYQSIETGNTTDSKGFERLREIITGLPKAD
jgi:flagellar motility protein MotE (MotC chaperone)